MYIYILKNYVYFKYNIILPWLVWLSGLSAGLWTKGMQVGFLVRAHAGAYM